MLVGSQKRNGIKKMYGIIINSIVGVAIFVMTKTQNIMQKVSVCSHLYNGYVDLTNCKTKSFREIKLKH